MEERTLGFKLYREGEAGERIRPVGHSSGFCKGVARGGAACLKKTEKGLMEIATVGYAAGIQ